MAAPHQQDRLLGLISAVAAGDAAREDVVAELRDANVDALDVLINVLAAATQKTHTRRASARPVDLQRLAGTAPARSATETVHRPPTQPFLLRGTVYVIDPMRPRRDPGRTLAVSQRCATGQRSATASRAARRPASRAPSM
jgi:hypothetical protein